MSIDEKILVCAYANVVRNGRDIETVPAHLRDAVEAKRREMEGE